MMQHVSINVLHFIMPGYEQARGSMLAGETIQHFLERSEWKFKTPTICILNGEPVLRSAWATTIVLSGDNIHFLSKPWGGGGQGGSSKQMQTLGIVAMIALAAFAPMIAVGLNSTLALGLGTAGLSLLKAGIVLGGALLVSTFLTPKPGGQPDPDTSNPDQVYSLSAAGNVAKPLGVIPVGYGKEKVFPDYGAQPWGEYKGDDMYLNVLLALGMGKYQIHKTYVDDTILSNDGVDDIRFDDVEIVQYDPGEPVTLFPVNVVTSEEVSGQELPDPDDIEFIGGFVANDAGTLAIQLAVDYAFPAGLFSTNAAGNTRRAAVTVVAEYRPVNAVGNPIGDWANLFTKTHDINQRKPKRYSEKVAVAPGRYEVRFGRTNKPSDDPAEKVDAVAWMGLRAFLQGPISYENVTMIAIRMKASEQLSESSAKKFGVLRTRILPVWNTGTMTMVETPTQNPAWAFYDAAVNTVYGAKRPPSKIDFQGILDLAAGATARGDTFNYTFTASVPVPQAFDTILKTTRTKHRWAGDVLTLVRDEWRPVPSMMLTDRQIVRNSLSIDYIFNDEEASDCVVLEYLDETTWSPQEVQYPPNSVGFTAEKPARIRLDGITNRQHAKREAAFFYFQSYYRRTKVTLDTEHDGRILSFGSVITVQSELPQEWGASGAVTDLTTNILTLHPAPVWAPSGTHYINLRSMAGKPLGPIRVTKGVTDDKAVLNVLDLADAEAQLGKTITEVLDRPDGTEDPSFDFGVGTKVSKRCIVLKGRPNGDNVTLELVVDLEAVHEGILADIPPVPSIPPVQNPKKPVIQGLLANFRQGVMEPMLDASWWPAKGARFYVADVSYDEGVTWTNIYEGIAASFSKVVDRSDLRLRVQGVGELVGAYTIKDVLVPNIKLSKGTVTPESFAAGLHNWVMVELSDLDARIEALRRQSAWNAADLDAHTLLQKYEIKSLITKRINSVQAQIANIQDINLDAVTGQITAINAQIVTLQNDITGIEAAVVDIQQIIDDQNGTISALSASIVSLQNSVTGMQASISTVSNLVSTINGKLTATWQVKLDVNGYVSGIQAFNDGSTTAFVIRTDIFKIVTPGGATPFSVFTTGTVAGATKVVIRGDMIADGLITAAKINVGTLTAITANFGTATVSGKLSSANGKMVIDFNNNRIEGYD